MTKVVLDDPPTAYTSFGPLPQTAWSIPAGTSVCVHRVPSKWTISPIMPVESEPTPNRSVALSPQMLFTCAVVPVVTGTSAPPAKRTHDEPPTAYTANGWLAGLIHTA